MPAGWWSATFWISAALVGFAYAGYPLALALLARLRSRPVTRQSIRPPVTFVITAHNEEQRLGGKLHNTLAQDYPADRFEVILIDGASDDRTRDVVGELMRGDSRVRLLDNPRRIVPTAMNIGSVRPVALNDGNRAG